MRRLKVFLFQVKLIYSKWFLFFLVLIIASSVPVWLQRGSDVRANFPGFTVVMLSLMLPMTIFGNMALIKSDVDFVFTTPVDPLEVLLIRSAAAGLTQLAVMLAYTLPAARAGAAYYIVSLLSLAAAFSTLNLMAAYSGPKRGAVAAPVAVLLFLGLYKPSLSPLYGLYEPSPAYAAYDLALLLALAAVIPRGRIRELASNAYELLGGPALLMPTTPRSVAVRGAGLPRSFWGAVWATSVRSSFVSRVNTPQGRIAYARRVNVIRVFLPASAASAIAYYVATEFAHDQSGLSLVAVFSFYLLYIFTFSALASTLSMERLWLSLSSDPVKYFKYRMSARTILTAIVMSPWIAAYALEGAKFPPALYLAAALGAAVLITPTLAWISGAYIGTPQTRELGLPVEAQRLTLKMALVALILFGTLGLFLAPYGLALAASYLPAFSGPLLAAATAYSIALLALSAAFFYLAVVSRRGYGLWRWLVDKLSENGYV